MHSHRVCADCSFISGEPFNKPSLNIGNIQLNPFLGKQNPGK